MALHVVGSHHALAELGSIVDLLRVLVAWDRALLLCMHARLLLPVDGGLGRLLAVATERGLGLVSSSVGFVDSIVSVGGRLGFLATICQMAQLLLRQCRKRTSLGLLPLIRGLLRLLRTASVLLDLLVVLGSVRGRCAHAHAQIEAIGRRAGIGRGRLVLVEGVAHGPLAESRVLPHRNVRNRSVATCTFESTDPSLLSSRRSVGGAGRPGYCCQVWSRRTTHGGFSCARPRRSEV